MEIQEPITEDELLEELAEEMERSERMPGDIDVQQLMKKTGKKREKIRDFLTAKVDAGELEARWILENGHRKKVYRKPDKKPKA